MTFSASEIEKALVDKGFVKKKNRKNHIFYVLPYDGKDTSIRTHISHGRKNKTLSKHLISKMAGQCLLCNRCFNKFVRNEMSKDDYLDHLRMLENVSGRTLLSASGGKPLHTNASACEDCLTKARQARGWQ